MKTIRPITTVLACAVALSPGVPCLADVVLDQIRLADPAGTARDLLGESVALSGDTLLAGCPQQSTSGQARAYLFDTATGAILFELTPDNDTPSISFGKRVALADGLAGVAESRAAGGGAVYLFDTDTGVQVAKLTPSDPSDGSEFGASVAIGNGMVAVGATNDVVDGISRGAVYIFDAATGEQLGRLSGSTASDNSVFARSVAIDGTTLAVGAPFNMEPVPLAGAVYLFDLTTLQEQRVLTMPTPAAFDGIGESVALGDGLVVVGATLPNAFQGRLHAFDASTGKYLFEMVAPAAGAPKVGRSVAVAGGRIAAGALVSECAEDSGAVYTFDATTGAYLDTLQPRICFEDGTFGASIDAEGDRIAVGAPTASLQSLPGPQGAAHIFDYAVFGCAANFNGDGFVNFFDLVDFLAAFSAQDPAVDIAPPTGVFNFFDVTAFLDIYSAGCP